MPVVLRPVSIGEGKIGWILERRSSRLAIYPDAWPVAIGTQAMLVEQNNPERGLALTISHLG